MTRFTLKISMMAMMLYACSPSDEKSETRVFYRTYVDMVVERGDGVLVGDVMSRLSKYDRKRLEKIIVNIPIDEMPKNSLICIRIQNKDFVLYKDGSIYELKK